MIKALHRWIPPALLDFYYRHAPGGTRFFGDFKSWEQAADSSQGYDHQAAIQAIYSASLAVKQGRANWERDGVLFDEVSPAWPVRAALLRVAARHQGVLRVLDYGGALGTTFHQHAPFLSSEIDLHWSVMEQPLLCELGRREFSEPRLQFFSSLEEAQLDGPYQLGLFGCVLPYVQHPYRVLQDVIHYGVPALLIDRTPVLTDTRDRLTIQKVSPTIYPASYPAWFFSETRLLGFLEKHGFELVASYECEDRANVPSQYRGYLLEQRS